MFLTVQPDGETPLYLQLREQIVNGVAAGELKPGDALPSVRQLASDLGINLHTVNKSYAVLKAEGYVKIGRRGVTVTEPPAYDGAFVEELKKKLSAIFKEAKSRGLTEDLLCVIAENEIKNKEVTK
ncbi:GntR family transcriptional regulator [Clostridia bacterium]|nr:GntR family transcriptional regulator [Clostridia bacterium]